MMYPCPGGLEVEEAAAMLPEFIVPNVAAAFNKIDPPRSPLALVGCTFCVFLLGLAQASNL